MFLLTNQNKPNQLSKSMLDKTMGIVKEAQERLADSFSGVVFDPVPHKYTIGSKEIRGVSSIVNYYAPFDTEKVAYNCSKNPKHEHFGKTVEQIIAIWEEKKKKAAGLGTQVHAFGEACCLYRLGRQDEIDEEYRYRITDNGLVAFTPKEEAVAKWWQQLDLNRYAVVAKETAIMNPDLFYAGTFDLLLYDIQNMSFCVRDYKTNEDLYKWYGGHLRAPLSMLKDNDQGKYTLQQNLYALQLNNLGLTVNDIKLLWLKDDTRYYEVQIGNYTTVVHYAMKNFPIQES